MGTALNTNLCFFFFFFSHTLLLLLYKNTNNNNKNNEHSKHKRLAVAPVGSTFENDAGEEITVQKTAVGGVMSEGIFCDSKMLGWAGGAASVAAQIPESVAIGESPPATKPRPGGAGGATTATEPLPASNVEGLFEKKLSKEEKKKLAEERRKARKAAKEGTKNSDE